MAFARKILQIVWVVCESMKVGAGSVSNEKRRPYIVKGAPDYNHHCLVKRHDPGQIGRVVFVRMVG